MAASGTSSCPQASTAASSSGGFAADGASLQNSGNGKKGAAYFPGGFNRSEAMGLKWAERRVALDGRAYTYAEYLSHYGRYYGPKFWAERSGGYAAEGASEHCFSASASEHRLDMAMPSDACRLHLAFLTWAENAVTRICCRTCPVAMTARENARDAWRIAELAQQEDMAAHHTHLFHCMRAQARKAALELAHRRVGM